VEPAPTSGLLPRSLPCFFSASFACATCLSVWRCCRAARLSAAMRCRAARRLAAPVAVASQHAGMAWPGWLSRGYWVAVPRGLHPLRPNSTQACRGPHTVPHSSRAITGKPPTACTRGVRRHGRHGRHAPVRSSSMLAWRLASSACTSVWHSAATSAKPTSRSRRAASLKSLFRFAPTCGERDHECNIIEAPWLVNGGHGASLRHH
jgi:hypothetical protein